MTRKRPSPPPDIKSPLVGNRDFLVYLAKSIYEMREELSEHVAVHRVLARLITFGLPAALTLAGLVEAWLMHSK